MFTIDCYIHYHHHSESKIWIYHGHSLNKTSIFFEDVLPNKVSGSYI